MFKGTVKFYNSTKGYGFIEDGTGTDLFFHVSDVKGTFELDKGDAVSFETEQSKRGVKACNVELDA